MALTHSGMVRMTRARMSFQRQFSIVLGLGIARKYLRHETRCTGNGTEASVRFDTVAWQHQCRIMQLRAASCVAQHYTTTKVDTDIGAFQLYIRCKINDVVTDIQCILMYFVFVSGFAFFLGFAVSATALTRLPLLRSDSPTYTGNFPNQNTRNKRNFSHKLCIKIKQLH